jgi:folate-binding protein YgfZ
MHHINDPSSNFPWPEAQLQSARSLIQGRCRLHHLGLIQVQGPQAAEFLHQQLTQDFLIFDARLAAFCSAQGRIQASFIVWKHDPETILLLCSHDLLAATLKRLSLFVLRSKVSLKDVTLQFQIWGVAGASIASPDFLMPPWHSLARFGLHGVTLYPALSAPRAIMVAPAGPTSASHLAEILALPEMQESVWLWSEVLSGVATVSLPLVNALVPQMLNYESVGGVNFKKGCYPGQEVVARSQFRGTLKRRTYLAHIQSDDPITPLFQPCAGHAVFDASDLSQPCGVMVQVAPRPPELGLDAHAGWDALLTLQTAAAHSKHLVVAAEHKATRLAPVTLLPLPYNLLEDI